MGRSRRAVDILLHLWPLGRVLNRLAGRPLLGPLLRSFYSAAANEAVIIPVQEAVRGAESVVLPFPLLAPLVERASARFVLSACLCRRAEGCQAYPVTLGCLFLGDAAAQIDPALGRPVRCDEALAHVARALSAGLVPMVVHASFDAWILGIPYDRMLAVCFCCDCCCTVRQGLRLGPPAFSETVLRLPGLSLVVGPACRGCGTCVTVCPAGAITLAAGRAQIDGACKGCGRCAASCPRQAITLRIDPETDPLAGLLARVEQRTRIGQP